MDLIDIDNYDKEELSFTKWINVNGGGYSLTFDILYHLLIGDQDLRSQYLGIMEDPETPKEELLSNLMKTFLPYCSFNVNEKKLSKAETKKRVKLEKLARETGETTRRNIEKLIKQRISNIWELDKNASVDVKYFNTLQNLDKIDNELKEMKKIFKQIENETKENKKILEELITLKELLTEHELEENIEDIEKRIDYFVSEEYIQKYLNKLKPVIQKIQLLTPFIKKINKINSSIMDLNEYISIDDAILTKETENEQYKKYNLEHREHNPLSIQNGNYKINRVLNNIPDLLDFL